MRIVQKAVEFEYAINWFYYSFSSSTFFFVPGNPLGIRLKWASAFFFSCLIHSIFALTYVARPYGEDVADDGAFGEESVVTWEEKELTKKKKKQKKKNNNNNEKRP